MVLFGDECQVEVHLSNCWAKVACYTTIGPPVETFTERLVDVQQSQKADRRYVFSLSDKPFQCDISSPPTLVIRWYGPSEMENKERIKKSKALVANPSGGIIQRNNLKALGRTNKMSMS